MSNLKELHQKAWQKIQQAKNILIVGHVNPDSDAISSVGALIELMKRINKKYTAYCQDKPIDAYNFLPHEEEILASKDFDLESFDLIIAVDCGSKSRTYLDKEIDEIRNDKVKDLFIIEFDHHPKFDKYSDIEIRNSEASSTTEVLYYFFKLNKIDFNKNIATSILSGILTDTANFLYPSTGKETVAISSEMLNYGAQFPKIVNRIWNNRSIQSIRLWSLALNNLQINYKYKVAFTVLRHQEIAEVLKSDEFFDSDIFGEIAGFLSNMADVKAVMLIREQEPGFIKGSFRASAYSDGIDLSNLAQILGGGGHAKAAGFTVDGVIEKNANSWIVK
ncbi:DHH family phosphoesterase [Patescibacteria group bacterium]|nr:DHH family phosphoesterase [Patescibacteria group bacterium]